MVMHLSLLHLTEAGILLLPCIFKCELTAFGPDMFIGQYIWYHTNLQFFYINSKNTKNNVKKNCITLYKLMYDQLILDWIPVHLKIFQGWHFYAPGWLCQPELFQLALWLVGWYAVRLVGWLVGWLAGLSSKNIVVAMTWKMGLGAM